MNENSFVCMSDVFGYTDGINSVIYNPKVYDEDYGKYLLKRIIKVEKHIELTNEELDTLFDFEDDINGFINALKKIVKKK